MKEMFKKMAQLSATTHTGFFGMRARKMRGFTLVEMLVAVSLFTIVMSIGVGALISLSDANKKANAIRATMDNLNFAMESMSRAIRTGTAYSCSGSGTPNCTNGGTELTLVDYRGQVVTYRMIDGANNIGRIDRRIGGGAGSFSPVTSPEVDIDISRSAFYVTGVGDDDTQPLVLISLQGTAGNGNIATNFALQTSNSERNVEQ